MKFMIASDIHGSARYCEQMLRAYERERAHRLLILGDFWGIFFTTVREMTFRRDTLRKK